MQRLIQLSKNNQQAIAWEINHYGQYKLVEGFQNIFELLAHTIEDQPKMLENINHYLANQTFTKDELLEEYQFLPALNHPDPFRCLVGGTGLTHYNRKQLRRAMERQPISNLTDAEKLYQDGLQKGKPNLHARNKNMMGAMPEWFFKGRGPDIKTHLQTLNIPKHTQCFGEEAEIVVAYYIDHQKHYHRLGFMLGNECADHELEKQNMFYISQCKLQNFSVGCELLLTSKLPELIKGRTYIYRNQKKYWGHAFTTGANNMVHSLENIERHLFKHEALLHENSLYLHFLGADIISYQDNIHYEDKDEVEIYAEPFLFPLKNTIRFL